MAIFVANPVASTLNIEIKFVWEQQQENLNLNNSGTSWVVGSI